MSEKFVYPPVKGGMLDRLPDRLREKSNDNPHGYMMREAAQEIDRLRDENAELREALEHIDAALPEMADDGSWLSGQLKEIRTILAKTAKEGK